MEIENSLGEFLWFNVECKTWSPLLVWDPDSVNNLRAKFKSVTERTLEWNPARRGTCTERLFFVFRDGNENVIV